MTTRNRIIALIFLTVIGNFFTLNAQKLVKKDKAKKNQNSIALQKDNKGLGQKLPTKENVTALLTDFDWDAKTTTNREEAFRILDAMGGEFLHLVPVGNRSFIVCSELPSGYFVCIGVNQKDPNRGRYSIRYGSMEDYSNIFRHKNGLITLSNKFLELNSYVFQKQTDLSHKASFLGVVEKDYKIDNRPTSIFSFSGSYGLKYLAENPPMFMTNRGRARTIESLISNFFDYDEENAPLILNENSQDDSIRGGDVIFGIVDKGKIDRINLDNFKKKLLKGKSLLKVILFRKGRFLVRNWDPTLRDYNYRNSTVYKFDRWWLREQLIFYVLNSGLEEPSDSFWAEEGAPILPSITTYGYSKEILDMFIEYGADIHLRYDLTLKGWRPVDDKIKIGYSLLHRAAKAHRHMDCTYYSHRVYKNGLQEDQEIYETAYFDLIALGLKDDQPLEKPHKTLGYSTPKEFYDLANNPDHIFRPKEKTKVDWGAIANAVIAGTSAALQEKQRQIQETQLINSINQSSQARIDAGIKAQRQQVAQSNAEYLARIQAAQQQTSTSVQNTITSSNNSSGSQTNQNDIPGYTNRQNIELNAGRNPASNLSSTNNTNPPTIGVERITYYSFRASLLDPSSLKDVPYNLDDTKRVINYRNQWVLNLRPVSNSLEEEWYPQLKKVEIVEVHEELPAEQIQYKKDQIRASPRQFLTYEGALGEVKTNFSRPPYWTLEEAQAAADERNRERRNN